MLCTNYDEMVNAIPQIEKNHDAVSYISGDYSSEGYEALCECIVASRHEDDKYFKYMGYSNTVTKYTIFHGWQPIEFKNFLHDCINHFGWQAVPAIESECLFGKAYVNAFKYASNNEYTCIPTAKMVFDELAKLLRKVAGEGYIIAEDAKEYLR